MNKTDYQKTSEYIAKKKEWYFDMIVFQILNEIGLVTKKDKLKHCKNMNDRFNISRWENK